MHLGLVGDQLGQHARLPDRLVGEVLGIQSLPEVADEPSVNTR